jgi:hypothetical protein
MILTLLTASFSAFSFEGNVEYKKRISSTFHIINNQYFEVKFDFYGLVLPTAPVGAKLLITKAGFTQHLTNCKLTERITVNGVEARAVCKVNHLDREIKDQFLANPDEFKAHYSILTAS